MRELMKWREPGSPAELRAERKMLRAARFLDLPMGSRRFRRWNRVANRNVARLLRAAALERRGPSSFVIRASSFSASRGGVL